MQRNLTLLLVVAALPGCGDPNAGALFADLQYATRCEETLGCDGPQDHDLCGIHRSDPCIPGPPSMPTPEASLSCSVTEQETTRLISFSGSQGGTVFSVNQAIIPFGGGSASGGNCEVRVTEGPNTYEGMCGSNTPSVAQPCQITGVSFYDNEGNAEFEGDIFCQFLENRTQPALHIEVTAKGNGPAAEMTPASFRIANCDGLTI